jgi:hypothetical protein
LKKVSSISSSSPKITNLRNLFMHKKRLNKKSIKLGSTFLNHKFLLIIKDLIKV